MKIAQFYDKKGVCLGIIESDSLFPIDYSGDMQDFIINGPLPEKQGGAISLSQVKLAPPVSRPSKIIAIGLNYKDHAKESKGELPKVPLIFAKFPNSIIGHGHDIVWETHVTNKVDFEAELVVIMGKKLFHCDEAEAMDAVFGYTCGNDVSARDLQFGDKQWVRGKSLDTFCPIGPWIVTPEELRDPHNVKIRCLLNQQVMQESNTSLMIFNIPTLISFCSHHFTLFPGDLILTGTPSGVGTFRHPSVYMKSGDEVVVEIESIGRLVNHCRTRE